MMIISSIKKGLTQISGNNKRLIFIFYFFNLAAGVLLMLPVRGMLNDYIGSSLMGAKLGGRLDMDFLFEFFVNNPQINDVVILMIIAAGSLYLLVSLLLSGGAFTTLQSGDQFNSTVFWGGAGKYFLRFFRLALWSIPVLAILFSLRFLETGVERVIFGSDPYENIAYWGNWIRFALSTTGILIFGLIFDYARIHAVITDERRMWVSLWYGLKFTFGNSGKTFGLALILFLIGWAVLGLYSLLADTLSAPSGLVILLLFVVQQVFMIFRMTLRLTLYAGEINLYDAIGTASRPVIIAESDTDNLGLEGAAG